MFPLLRWIIFNPQIQYCNGRDKYHPLFVFICFHVRGGFFDDLPDMDDTVLDLAEDQSPKKTKRSTGSEESEDSLASSSLMQGLTELTQLFPSDTNSFDLNALASFVDNVNELEEKKRQAVNPHWYNYFCDACVMRYVILLNTAFSQSPCSFSELRGGNFFHENES